MSQKAIVMTGKKRRAMVLLQSALAQARHEMAKPLITASARKRIRPTSLPLIPDWRADFL